MAQLMEKDQVGKRESLADLIANVESDATPFSSMAHKRKKPNAVVHDWQVKQYKKKGHRGVPDGQDAKDFGSNDRSRLHSCAQKVWDLPGVSDFSEESEVAGVAQGEMAEQVADALVTVKQTVERRCLSNSDCFLQDSSNPLAANETRGIFMWGQTTAQTTYAVPEKYRPNSSQVYSGTLAAFKESSLKNLAKAAWKRRMGNAVSMKFFSGIDLKAAISDFTRYDDTVSNKTCVRCFNTDAEEQAIINCIDRVVFDTGAIDLFASAHIITDADTGEDTLYTHSSGVGVDMDKIGIAWTRMPRVVKLQYNGGGHKAIVDAIFLLMCDNPTGMFTALINS